MTNSNIKLLLGIIIPFMAILSLVVLSVTTAETGISFSEETEESVRFDKTHNSRTHIYTRTITNDFFMPKKYELPKLIFCLNDKQMKERPRMPSISYEEGFYEKNSELPVFNKGQKNYNIFSDINIELPANSKKQIKFFVNFDYLLNREESNDYEILLIKDARSNSGYDPCSNLNSEEFESATHIEIIN